MKLTAQPVVRRAIRRRRCRTIHRHLTREGRKL
jgi:hypothetical protein